MGNHFWLCLDSRLFFIKIQTSRLPVLLPWRLPSLIGRLVQNRLHCYNPHTAGPHTRQSCWSSPLDPDEVLVCTKLSMCSGGCFERTVYLNDLKRANWKTGINVSGQHHQRWPFTDNRLLPDPECFLRLDAFQSVWADGEHNQAQLTIRLELNASHHRDHGIWLSQRPLTMKRSTAMRASSKLFHLFRYVNETVCEVDSSLSRNR